MTFGQDCRPKITSWCSHVIRRDYSAYFLYTFCFRFHKFCLSGNCDDEDISTRNPSVDFNRHPKLEVGVRHDVIELWEELDTARNTLAEIQGIQIHISQRQPVAAS